MDHLQEIGEFLHDERSRQKISLEDLSRHTCVSVRMLEALEQGRYDDVGTPLLIRGFIRSYCKALGIDAEPVLEKYAGEMVGYSEQDESLKRYSIWMQKPSRKSRYLLYSIIAAVVLALGFVGASIWLPARSGKNSQVAKAPEALIYPQKDLPQDLPRKNGPEQPAETAEKPTTETRLATENTDQPAGTQEPAISEGNRATTEDPGSAAEDAAGLQTPAPDAAAGTEMKEAPEVEPAPTQTAAEPSTETTTADHVLVLEAIEETWLQVENAAGEKENRLMKPGEQRRWDVSERIRLWLGNAGGIRATWDGRTLKPFGKRGQVVRLKLPDPNYLSQ